MAGGWHRCAGPRCWIQVSPYSVYCDMHQREYDETVMRRVLEGAADGTLIVSTCDASRAWEKEDEEKADG